MLQIKVGQSDTISTYNVISYIVSWSEEKTVVEKKKKKQTEKSDVVCNLTIAMVPKLMTKF